MAALLATGIVGGFAASSYLEPDPITTGAPQPVSAEDPRFPTDPAALQQEDPTEPALKTGLEMVDVTVGSGSNAFVFPAPKGWRRLEPSSNEVKYKVANNPANTYVLRVEQVVSEHETIRDIVAATKADLERDFEQVEVIQTYDTLEYSYVYEGYRRFGITSWLDISLSDQAEAEIAVTGRRVDVPGMEELIAKVIRGIRAG